MPAALHHKKITVDEDRFARMFSSLSRDVVDVIGDVSVFLDGMAGLK